MIRDAPLITTERLTLRPAVAEDFELLAALYETERSRHIGGPLSRAAAWKNFMGSIGHWPILGFGGWSIAVTETGECVGEVAFSHPPEYPELELGWTLYGENEGKGFAREAAAAALAFGRDTLRATTLVSYIDPENLRSQRLALHLGGLLDPEAATPNGDPTLVYRYW